LKRPWRLHQNYALNSLTLRYSKIEDREIVFSRAAAGVASLAATAAA